MIFQGILDLQIPSFSIIFHHFSLSFSSHILFDPAKERDRFNEAMASNADLTKNLDPDRHGDPHGGSTRMTQTRPPDVFQRSTWCTGIFPRSQIIVIGLKNKRIYRYYPPDFFCALYLWSSFYRWIGLCKQMAATSDCCVGFLVSFSWVECGSPGMWPKLSESWDLCPSVLLGVF